MCGTAVLGGRVAERLERRDPGRAEPLDLVAADARDADEVVVGVPALVAERRGRRRARSDRPGTGTVAPRRVDRLEALARPPVEGGEVAGRNALARAGAEHDVHPLGQPPLDARELASRSRAGARRRLRVPRELRVDGLVRSRRRRERGSRRTRASAVEGGAW